VGIDKFRKLAKNTVMTLKQKIAQLKEETIAHIREMQEDLKQYLERFIRDQQGEMKSAIDAEEDAAVRAAVEEMSDAEYNRFVANRQPIDDLLAKSVVQELDDAEDEVDEFCYGLLRKIRNTNFA
jgi:DNA-binding MurR/RpiR family transcriptional regulator